MTEKLPGAAQTIQDALMDKGIKTRVLILPDSARTAKDAAAAIGCQVDQIAKSLIFQRTDTQEAVLVIAKGSNRVDEELIATYLNAQIVKASADFVRAATGFAIGGIPPLGHKQAIWTFMDQSLLEFEVVWAAAGTPHAVFSITPQQLVEVTGGQVVAVSS